MTIAFVADNEYAISNASSQVVTIPTGWAAGDLLVVIAEHGYPANTATRNIVGWTFHVQYTDNGSYGVWSRIAATGDTTWTWTFDNLWSGAIWIGCYNAAKIMADMWQDKYVYGGKPTIVKTSFGDSTLPMFDAKGPKCFMNMNGNFITSFFPEGLKAGVDYGAFYFPPIDPKYGSPAEVAGDIWGASNDRPEVMAVMEYFTKGEHLKGWMEQGGAMAPQKDADLSWYGSPVEQVIGKAIVDANTLRFDGSDLMPGAVGAGSFWKEMTSFVAGAEDINTALKNIDASWPK